MSFETLPKISEDVLDKAAHLGKVATLVIL